MLKHVCGRRLNMDWTTEWPWNLEEEAEWKAELARREHGVDDGSSYDVIRWFPNAASGR